MIFLIGFASFGIVYIIKFTDGPFDVFCVFRRLIKLEIPLLAANGSVVDWYTDEEPETFIAKLVACFWCTTVWVSLIFTMIYFAVSVLSPWLLILYWFGSVGLSGFLYEILHGENI